MLTSARALLVAAASLALVSCDEMEGFGFAGSSQRFNQRVKPAIGPIS